VTTDPGWMPAFRGALWSMNPFKGIKARERARSTRDGLTQFRTIWLALVLAVILYSVAFSFIMPIDGGDEGWFPAAVIVVGTASILGVALVGRRPWQPIPTSPEALVAQFRTDFFIQIGIAELPALGTSAGLFVVQNSLWVYFVGGAFSLASFWVAAPTSTNIEWRQRKLAVSGSGLSVLDALIRVPPR
jgi:hypothetical protein